MRTWITDLEKGQIITDFFLVRASGTREAKSGKPFGTLTLADKSGEVDCKKWDISEVEANLFETLKPGDVVKVKASVDEFNDAAQLIIIQIRQAKDTDTFDMSEILKVAPIDEEIMYDVIVEEFIPQIEDEEYREVCLMLYEENREKLLYWPAAQKIHHAHKGGLLWHTYRMAQHAISLADIYQNVDKSLLVAGTLLHDIAKTVEMDSNQFGIVDDYTTEGKLLGHLITGVMMIEEAALAIGMDGEKKLMLQHMIASHHGTDPSMGSAKKPCLLESFMLYQIDTMDMYAYVAEEEMSKTNGGEMTSKLYALGNEKLYRPTYYED